MPLIPPLPPPSVPCPLAAGWEVVARSRLPRTDPGGAAQGGFSAAAVVSHGPAGEERDELWLLSDAPRGELRRWRGVGELPSRPLQPLPGIPLRGGASRPLPAAIDAEGLVVRDADVWVASEGRRRPDRVASLLLFDRRDGRLKATVPLPSDWRDGPGRGLESNGGPESLTLLPAADGKERLLLAGELPLRQDPPDRVRLVALPLGPPADGQPRLPLQAWTSLTPLRLPGEGWGLTDLLALPASSPSQEGALLALFRRFEPPLQWQARLSLYPLPGPAASANQSLTPLISWDLLAMGLPADNWEAMAWLNPSAGKRARLLLASDDNFSPLQSSHLAVITPRRSQECPPPE